jgi:hypothetical protein
VVASDGTLGGYAGGLDAKRRLLKLERGVEVPPGGWPPAHLSRTYREQRLARRSR